MVNPSQMPSTSAASATTTATAPSAQPPPMEVDKSWEEHVYEEEVTLQNFDSLVQAHKEKGKSPKRVICSAIKGLLGSPTVDSDFALRVVKAAGHEDGLLKNPSVLFALMALLNEESGSNKLTLALLPTLISMLEKADAWAPTLVHYGLNDSLGSRVWVDRAEASPLLQAIFSYFGPIAFPHESSYSATELLFTHREPSAIRSKFQPTAGGTNDPIRSAVASYFEKSVGGSQVTKNLLRTMAFCTPASEVR